MIFVKINYFLRDYEYHSEPSPMPHAHAPCPFASSFTASPSRSSKMPGIYSWIAVCLPTEIDAFVFSGPDQVFNGAPAFSRLQSKMIFRRRSDRCRCVDRSRRSEFYSGLHYVCMKKSAHFYFQGPNNFSTARQHIRPFAPPGCTSHFALCTLHLALLHPAFCTSPSIDRSRSSKMVATFY